MEHSCYNEKKLTIVLLTYAFYLIVHTFKGNTYRITACIVFHFISLFDLLLFRQFKTSIYKVFHFPLRYISERKCTHLPLNQISFLALTNLQTFQNSTFIYSSVVIQYHCPVALIAFWACWAIWNPVAPVRLMNIFNLNSTYQSMGIRNIHNTYKCFLCHCD